MDRLMSCNGGNFPLLLPACPTSIRFFGGLLLCYYTPVLMRRRWQLKLMLRDLFHQKMRHSLFCFLTHLFVLVENRV